MPLLLLLPLVLVFFVLLWALLMPVALWQRYRLGKARRRAVPWLVRFNLWLLVLSVAFLLVSGWVAGHWVVDALAYSAAGLALGIAAGLAGLALTKFQHEQQGLFYTPNRWIVLLLTLIVAGRIGYGLVRAWQAWQAEEASSWLLQQGSMMAVAGLLLGYYLAYTWGLRRRLSRRHIVRQI